MEPMICQSCGRENDQQAVFCNNCGASLVHPAPGAAQPMPASDAAPSGVSAPSPNGYPAPAAEAPASAATMPMPAVAPTPVTPPMPQQSHPHPQYHRTAAYPMGTVLDGVELCGAVVCAVAMLFVGLSIGGLLTVSMSQVNGLVESLQYFLSMSSGGSGMYVASSGVSGLSLIYSMLVFIGMVGIIAYMVLYTMGFRFSRFVLAGGCLCLSAGAVLVLMSVYSLSGGVTQAMQTLQAFNPALASVLSAVAGSAVSATPGTWITAVSGVVVALLCFLHKPLVEKTPFGYVMAIPAKPAM